jgi:hypothetical protein
LIGAPRAHDELRQDAEGGYVSRGERRAAVLRDLLEALMVGIVAEGDGVGAFGDRRRLVERGIGQGLGALVAIDRRAFWPGLYANPSQQPIEVQPPFNDLAAPGWPPEMLSLALGRSTDPAWPAPYLESWQANFDFVLVLDAGATQGIANYLPDRLTLIASSRFAALFRIRS